MEKVVIHVDERVAKNFAHDIRELESASLSNEDWKMDVESFFERGCDMNTE
jgi:hypothetical protein